MTAVFLNCLTVHSSGVSRRSVSDQQSLPCLVLISVLLSSHNKIFCGRRGFWYSIRANTWHNFNLCYGLTLFGGFFMSRCYILVWQANAVLFSNCKCKCIYVVPRFYIKVLVLNSQLCWFWNYIWVQHDISISMHIYKSLTAFSFN